MNKKMMARPVGIADIVTVMYMYIRRRIVWLKLRPKLWTPITVVALVASAVFVSYQTPVASATNASVALSDTATVAATNSVTSSTEVVHTSKGNCTLHIQEYAPGTKPVEDLLGPSYATVWVNQSVIPAKGPYQGIRGQNPPWGQAERKVLVSLYEEVHLFWPGGTFVSATPRTSYCLTVIKNRYKADSRAAMTRRDVEANGLGLFSTDLR